MLVKTVDSVQKIGNGFVKQWNDFVQAKELDEPYPLQEAIHFAQSLQKEVLLLFYLCGLMSSNAFPLFVCLTSATRQYLLYLVILTN